MFQIKETGRHEVVVSNISRNTVKLINGIIEQQRKTIISLMSSLDTYEATTVFSETGQIATSES